MSALYWLFIVSALATYALVFSANNTFGKD
jgi:hypothetical protein